MPAPRRAIQSEPDRLHALYQYEVLDSPPEPSFDRLTALAARLFNVSIALVSLIDRDRQWFKSMHGLRTRETSTRLSFCKHTLAGDTVLVVPDATDDARFADNALVTGAPYIRFYAGAPLITPDGYNLGSLCIIDDKPRAGLSEADQRTLQDLADIAVDELELRRHHREKETGLRQQAERVTHAVELAQDAISLLNADNRFVYINRATATLYGYPVDELLGQPLDLIYDSDGRQRLYQEVLPVLRNNGAWHGTCKARHRNGSVIEQEVSLAALPDGGMVRVARDVTARNAAQRTRRRLRAELHQAQKLESVGRLAGGIAHDFNNVLAAIAGYAGFLVDDLPQDSAEAGYARQIASAAERGKTLVQQILSFSRRDSLSMTAIDISEVVSETAGLLSAALPRELHLNCELPEALLRVRGNESALGRAVMNLATNARDAVADLDAPSITIVVRHRSTPIEDPGTDRTEATEMEGVGPVRLLDLADGRHELRIGQINHPGGTIEVSVIDGGAGIPLDKLERVLEPFYTTKTVGKGTGLGLSAVSGIALSHDGGLTIRTGEGRGTEVTMHFAELAPTMGQSTDTRASLAAHAPVATTADRVAAVNDPTSDTRRLVLIVDDEQTVAQMTADTVIRLGRPALTTTSANRALEIVHDRHGEIAHLITDLNMPEMMGSDLAQAVKGIDPAIAITLISGRTPLAEGDPASAIDHVLQKPIARDQLERVLSGLAN
ncbi:ATP-binding protein [Rhodovibrio salinarum]|uniref:histidine kinase n=1 Tax=Rhodovibrio salinarum TaxID=1087 RepID=A0A934QI53_9PROT|nr:ATP-binding protein [Rhodovibrio salinarum]MBK1697471.1 hybrid sensor histidine kinase/response regulator [Rhodovibrio salinarum]